MNPSLERLTAGWRGALSPAKRADILAVLVAVTLPWSTTATWIAVVLWIVALLPTIDRAVFQKTLSHPASVTAIVFFALGALGMLWADAPWHARFDSLGSFLKFLTIPLLLYHFQKSERGFWVFAAFLASCVLLMIASWAMYFVPALANPAKPLGVPVKNTIAQSQEFAACAFALALPILHMFRTGRRWAAWVLLGLAAAFIANLLFVASARTVLACIVALLVLFAIVHLRGRAVVILLLGSLAAGTLIWQSSPYLQNRTTRLLVEYQDYRDTGAITSPGERLEFWKKSLRFFADAPVLGHGTGSIQTLFERAAIGQTGIAASVRANPHNQTLSVAVQLGLVGIVGLYAMWFVHLRLFLNNGLAAWIGLVVVVQNFVSSLFNSHLFDFVEGWIYALGVGIAGGMVLKVRKPTARPSTATALKAGEE